MSGLSGFIAKPGKFLPVSLILRMSDLIIHRGPDDEGYLFLNRNNEIYTAGGKNTPIQVWKTFTPQQPRKGIADCSQNYSMLALGHRRLLTHDFSPVDHLPMSFNNGKYWIVFDGIMYNYRDVRQELLKTGYKFITNSDAETVLAAYSEWGDKCFERFVGMWAIAIYDHSNKEIILSRDRYGIKPLYYYFSPSGDFYFASEIKQFTVLKEWNAQMNPTRVCDYLIHSFTDHTDETMFLDVFQLPAGSRFKSKINNIHKNKKGRINHYRWYQPVREVFLGSFVDAATEFRELFERAISEHLFTTVPVGTALSGGLDSSSIVCEVNNIIRKRKRNNKQKTFSVYSEYESYSEKKWMDIVIKFVDSEASFIYSDLDELFEITPTVLWFQDEPYQSQSAFLGFKLFQNVNSNNVKVLLNGQGADEYLGGYGQFTVARYADMIRYMRFSELISELKNTGDFNFLSMTRVFSGVTYHMLPDNIKRTLTMLKSSSDNVRKIIDVKRLNIFFAHPFDQIPVSYKTVPDISRHLVFYSTLPKYLHWEDRNSMANSVEARTPFLDHRLVEFAYNLPDDFLEKDGVNKRIMREAFDSLIPEQIKNRKDKMGFTTPEEMWVRKEKPTLFRKKLEEAIELTDGIVKPGALDYFDAVVNGKYKFDYTYWRLILFSLWIKKFSIKIS